MLQLTPTAVLIPRRLRRPLRLHYEDIAAVAREGERLRLIRHAAPPLTSRACAEDMAALEAILAVDLGPLEDIEGLRAGLEGRLRLPGFAARPFVEALLRASVALNISDLHLQPDLEGRWRLSARLDGLLRPLMALPSHPAQRVIGRLKAMAAVQIHRVDKPQEGRAALGEGWIRLSFTPTVAGEAVTLRLFDRLKGQAQLASLGFGSALTARLERLSQRPRGLLLLSGPSGSGKTTTLYTLLRRRVAEAGLRALTVEDPVEYRLEGVVQMEARGEATQPDLLKAALRHDADLLVVGEAREAASVSLMLKAALTGHLVFATVHAGSPEEALRRLLSLGAPPDLLADVLLAVLNQRLLRQRCCPAGCPRCGGVGYLGRRAIGALLEADARLREALRAGEAWPESADLLNEAQARVAAGETDAAEVARVLGQPGEGGRDG
ncbi:Flp pilus assembly complex ATPase component TadA [Myxococcota bacterium]|nr:Flp pilus assembly complex ATPase component TadA [Myxococcota bacterium]MBU1432413.1 Flp pilus assembly complex ATPase component TadA [Myxococcota bacterium]MBU1900343.1 Flp pilus assembly complex ATPase component TadA [Myxococcota bacterium]